MQVRGLVCKRFYSLGCSIDWQISTTHFVVFFDAKDFPSTVEQQNKNAKENSFAFDEFQIVVALTDHKELVR